MYSKHGCLFKRFLKWIENAALDSHILGVLHTGDITQNNEATHEWAVFKNSIDDFSKKIPFVSNIGDHDYTWDRSSKITDRNSTHINEYCNFALVRDRIVASFLWGSQKIYDFIHLNPSVQMRDIAYTNNPFIIAQNTNVVSINSATEIDLTGQVCADSIGSKIYSGTGGQLDFVRGAKMSNGGKSIIAMASRTAKGHSKIVPILKQGAGEVTPKADVQWIVTEYGAVNLYGKSLQERAELMISIAHPDDREWLDETVRENRSLISN